MSKQLEALQKGVQDIKDMLVQAQKGDLYAARRFVVQQEQLVAEGRKLGVDLSSAIEAHLGSVRSVYSAVRDRLRNRASEVVGLIDDTGKILDHDAYDDGSAHERERPVSHPGRVPLRRPESGGITTWMPRFMT